jgi:predicted phage baseplate assembly protein
VGGDPDDPPLAWEAFDGDRWVACEVESDSTGGLNVAGEVILHVPRSHRVGVIAMESGGWLRCRVVEPWEGQPFYTASPQVTAVTASTIGGTTQVVHAELVPEEVIGLSEGVPGQRFPVQHPPIVAADEPVTLEVAGGARWQEWTLVANFADSGPDDRHFVLDAVAGEVQLGPLVREADGPARQYGAVPPKGAPLRLRGYRTGGGQAGNVTAGAINVLKSTIPYVEDEVVNRRPATGGVDGETLENAKLRGPITVRNRGRAVTAEDYEQLAREIAPEVARVRCAPAGSDGVEAGAVRVLVVPDVIDTAGRLDFEQLLPREDTLERITRHLDERRLIGARVLVEPPAYQGVTIVARLRARPRFSPTRLQTAGLEALYRYFHPITGGPDGQGWPFGRPLHVGEVYSVLQGLEGTELVEEATIFPADPVTGERGAPTQRLELSEHALIFSFEHSVLAEET